MAASNCCNREMNVSFPFSYSSRRRSLSFWKAAPLEKYDMIWKLTVVDEWVNWANANGPGCRSRCKGIQKSGIRRSDWLAIASWPLFQYHGTGIKITN